MRCCRSSSCFFVAVFSSCNHVSFFSYLTCRDFFEYSALDASSFVASYSQLVFQDDMLSFSRQGTRIAVMNICRTNCNKQFDPAKFDFE